METRIKNIIENSIKVKQQLLTDPSFILMIEKVSKEITRCYRENGKVLLCGNGGSAADAQHIAAELSGRFYYDRPSLAAEAIHVNTSYMTAVANDYSFNDVYARYVQGAGRSGDLLFGITTSGNSENIIRAFIEAKKKGMKTVALTGNNGGKIKEYADFLINIPSSDTPRIQEAHILAGHILCELVEAELFPE